jgi:hypothetical protein
MGGSAPRAAYAPQSMRPLAQPMARGTMVPSAKMQGLFRDDQGVGGDEDRHARIVLIRMSSTDSTSPSAP